MQNMTVRSWLVMTNNFEHKGKNNFQIKKTNQWMGKNSKTLFCKFIARGWKWNVHESVSNDIQINFFNNHHYWNYLYLWEILPWQMYDNMQTNENTLQYEWDFKINTSNLQFPKLCIILWPLSVFKDQSLFFGIMTKVLLSSTWLSSFTIYRDDWMNVPVYRGPVDIKEFFSEHSDSLSELDSISMASWQLTLDDDDEAGGCWLRARLSSSSWQNVSDPW